MDVDFHPSESAQIHVNAWLFRPILFDLYIILKPGPLYHSKTNSDSSLELRFSYIGGDKGTLTDFIILVFFNWFSGNDFHGLAND